MREWHLKNGDPLCLPLAADARISRVDYPNDIIWEISLGKGEPPAVVVQTTFGLRARSFRMFPRFSENESEVTNPVDFSVQPEIRHFFPNYLQLQCSPFPDIDVSLEYWVPQSNAIAGRIFLRNLSGTLRRIRLDWIAQLVSTEGRRMAATEIQAVNVLSGNTENLFPLVFMTGGPEPGSGSYPSLTYSFDLIPGDRQGITWTHASSDNLDSSFTIARNLAALNWEAECSRIELENSGQVEIYTGEPDWDAAFSMAQKCAFSSFVSASNHLPEASFVTSRLPDHGYSLRGDGSDYNHLWNGQTIFEAAYLSGLIMPGNATLAKGLVRNFLAVQESDGFIDWKPGLAGQRSRLLASPMIADLAWSIYQWTEDRNFLSDVFQPLVNFLRTWFKPEHDRDQDGIPEWDHPAQAGLEEHPLYSLWSEGSSGIDISTSEGPVLCALLYRECLALEQIGTLLQEMPINQELIKIREKLLQAIDLGWDDQVHCFYDWDRDTHSVSEKLWLGERNGSGDIPIWGAYDNPFRILIKVRTTGESTRRPNVIIHGTSVSGHHRVERLTEENFRWLFGNGILTGERIYVKIEQVEISGLDTKDQVELFGVGHKYPSIATLIPLWAKMITPERAQEFVEGTISSTNSFWRNFGIPSFPVSSDENRNVSMAYTVSMFWNSLVGEGFMEYGFREQAAQLVTKLMAAVINNLKEEGSFRRQYDPETGTGSGDRNAIGGLPPLQLFLKVLGIQIINPWKIRIEGINPYPWPVTVKYQGLTILRQKEKTVVIFPDGQTTTITDPNPCLVSLE